MNIRELPLRRYLELLVIQPVVSTWSRARAGRGRSSWLALGAYFDQSPLSILMNANRPWDDLENGYVDQR